MLLHQIEVHFTVRAPDDKEAMRILGNYLTTLTNPVDENEYMPVQDYSIEQVVESYEEQQTDLPFSNE